MSDADRFLGFEGVELSHARGLPTETAKAIFNRYLSNGRWKLAAGNWLLLAQNLGRRGDSEVDGLGVLKTWLSHVADDEIENAHQEVLPSMLGWGFYSAGADEIDEDRRRDAASALVSWLEIKAGVGHARFLATVLESALMPIGSRSTLVGCFAPLARNLVRFGSAELRTRNHARLLIWILELFRELHDPSIVPAFEIQLAGDHEVSAWAEFRYPHGPWPAIEMALGLGLPVSRAIDVMTRLAGSGTPKRAWIPLSTLDLPRSKNALISSLVRGVMPMNAGENGWRLAILCLRPQDLHGELSLRTLAACRDAVTWCLSAQDSTWQVVAEGQYVDFDPRRVAEWAGFVAQETLRLAGTVNSSGARRAVVDGLLSIVGWSSNFPDDISANRSIVDLLTKWIKESSSPERGLDLALEILECNPKPSYAVRAALECLFHGGCAPVEGSNVERDLARLRMEIERLISLPWLDLVFGVRIIDGLCLTGCRVEFQSLDAEAKIEIEAGVVRVDPDYFSSLIQQFGYDEGDVLALCLLYFAHELIHLQQGVGDYGVVQSLRAAGSEMVLMHLDLTADHAATLMIHRAYQRWTIKWLKRLVFKSFESFPANSFHTHAARYRKSARLVSCRLDLLARERGLVPAEIEDDYLFTDYGPAGGPMFVLAYGPPIRALGQIVLNPDEAKILGNAADFHEDSTAFFRSLDTILERALDSTKWK